MDTASAQLAGEKLLLVAVILITVGVSLPLSQALGLFDWGVTETNTGLVGFALLGVAVAVKRQARWTAWLAFLLGQSAATESSNANSSATRARTLKHLRWLLLAQGFAAWAAAQWVPFESWWRTDISRAGWTLQSLGLMAIIWAIASRWVYGARLLLAGYSGFMVGVVALAMVIACQPISQKGQYGRAHFCPWGWHGVPGGRIIQWDRRDFVATYHFDAEGWRVTPKPAASAEDVLCLGCSLSFGAGVEDNQTYPWLLGELYWQNRHVRNLAVSGRGLGEALVIAEDWFARHARPAAVLYGWFPGHASRNYSRGSFHKLLPQDEFLLFDVENGKLIRKGLFERRKANLPDSPEVSQREREISLALFEELRGLCLKQDVPFYVVSLLRMDDVIEELKRRDYRVIDVGPVSASKSMFFPHDGHPNAAWHREVARLIAEQLTP